MANEHFGACLKHARAHKLISQNRLAAETGMTQGTISSYESGRTIPTEESARKLAAAMGLLLRESEGDFYLEFPSSESLTRAQMQIIGKVDEDVAGDTTDSADEDALLAVTVRPVEDPEESAETEKENLEETASPTSQAEKAKLITESVVARATLEQIREEIETYEQNAAKYGLSVEIASEALHGIISAVELMERLVGE